MHRSLRSTIAMVAAAAAVSGGLVACGGDDGGDTGASTTPTEATTSGSGGGGGGGGNAELSAQVGAGEQVYASSCAMCHGDNGSGGNGPALIGEDADLSYENGQELLDYISEQMPASSPGSLDEQQYLDVTAYILEADGMLDEPLTSGSAADVSLAD